jgi:DNA-binding response OmpR family regulator
MENTIFVVDDNELMLNIVSVILDGQGYGVKTWNRASGLLEHVQQQQPSLIILDVELPDGDGRDLCRQIKQSAEMRNIPVVICTGLDDIDEGTNPVQPDAVLYKPFDMNQLLNVVQEKLPRAA